MMLKILDGDFNRLHFLFPNFFLKVGDGTTSVVLLAVELLTQIKSLVEEDVHPQVLIKGYRKATNLVGYRH